MKKVAIIPAAGVGERMKLGMPKQFFEVGEKPLLVYTLEVFETCAEIDEIVVVTMAEKVEFVKEICRQWGIAKVGENVVVGGATNGESIYNGVQYVAERFGECDVLVHDGDRCLVTEETIGANWQSLVEFGSAVTVIPVTEAIYRAGEGWSTEYISRDGLYRIQTPYAYHLGDLLSLHHEAEVAGLDYRNIAPCLLMQMVGRSSHLVVGTELNFKITNPEDLELFEAVLGRDES